MRTPYASQYLLPTNLAMPHENAPKAPDPYIGENVVIGADLRTFYFQEDRDRLDNFAQMQAAVYLLFQLDERYSAYIHQEFGQTQDNVQAYEAYGMGNILPANGYVRVGKLVPSFGWRQPDHRMFTRRIFVFLPDIPPHSDVGFELGIYPKSFFLTASVTNGNFSGGFDSDDKVAFTTRGEWRWSRGELNLAIGASYFRNERATAERQAYGPFAGLHWKILSYTGELDWSRTEEPTGTTTGLTTSNELAVRIVQGFWAVGTYDFHDPDTDLATGAVQRAGVGLDLLPYSFLALRGRLNFFAVDEGSAITIDNGFPTDLTQDVTQFTGEIQVLF